VLLLPLWAPRFAPDRLDRRSRIAGIAAFALWIALSVAGALMEGR
jgi:hypothetical protein